MFERLGTVRNISFALALAIGAGSLAGCGNHHEGAGQLPILECDDKPTSNTLTLGNFPEGKSFRLGENLYYAYVGNTEGGAEITSLGHGRIKIVHDGTETVSGGPSADEPSDDPAATKHIIIPGNTISFQDGREHFVISATQTEQDQTSLTIQARCTAK